LRRLRPGTFTTAIHFLEYVYMAAPSRPRRLVGVSLKMYFDIPKTQKYIQGVKSGAAKPTLTSSSSLTSSPYLKPQGTLKGTQVMLGAQDAFWEDTGAYTGRSHHQS
jgi:triosephosphate isomerase